MSDNDLRVLEGFATDSMPAVLNELTHIEWAEEEIVCAQARWPKAADVLFHCFAMIAPLPVVSMSTESVYRAFARELLDRVARGDDVRVGTAVEACLVLRDISLNAPLTHEAFGLYLRMWRLAGLPALDGVDMGFHIEATSGARIDELEREIRKKCTVVARGVGEVECRGQHHGVSVECRFVR